MSLTRVDAVAIDAEIQTKFKTINDALAAIQATVDALDVAGVGATSGQVTSVKGTLDTLATTLATIKTITALSTK